MANPATARGLYNPRPKTQGAIRLTKKTATAEIFKGDPVTFNATGGATRVANATPSSVVPHGVASHYAASGAEILCYANLGDLEFEVMHDGTPASTNVEGQVYRLTTAAGNATTQQSGTSIDTSDAGNAASTVRVVDMIDRPDNDNALANPVNYVEFVKWAAAPVAS